MSSELHTLEDFDDDGSKEKKKNSNAGCCSALGCGCSLLQGGVSGPLLLRAASHACRLRPTAVTTCDLRSPESDDGRFDGVGIDDVDVDASSPPLHPHRAPHASPGRDDETPNAASSFP